MNTDMMTVSCGCGATEELRTAHAYRTSDWTFFGDADVLEGDTHYGYCPECSTTRTTSIVQDSSDTNVLHVTLDSIVLPQEFSSGGDADEIGERLSVTLPDGTPVLGLCTECREPICSGARREGPDAPEVGWTHYVCPSCRTVLSATQLEDAM